MSAALESVAGLIRWTELSCERCPATVTMYGHDPGHAREYAETKGWRSDWKQGEDWCPLHALYCPVMNVNLPPLPPGATRWEFP